MSAIIRVCHQKLIFKLQVLSVALTGLRHFRSIKSIKKSTSIDGTSWT